MAKEKIELRGFLTGVTRTKDPKVTYKWFVVFSRNGVEVKDEFTCDTADGDGMQEAFERERVRMAGYVDHAQPIAIERHEIHRTKHITRFLPEAPAHAD